MPSTLEDDEIEAILSKVDALVSWAGDIKEYALQQAVSGKGWKDWKIVEGRSNRKYVNETLWWIRLRMPDMTHMNIRFWVLRQ